jgi:hypothetical protein
MFTLFLTITIVETVGSTRNTTLKLDLSSLFEVLTSNKIKKNQAVERE